VQIFFDVSGNPVDLTPQYARDNLLPKLDVVTLSRFVIVNLGFVECTDTIEGLTIRYRASKLSELAYAATMFHVGDKASGRNNFRIRLIAIGDGAPLEGIIPFEWLTRCLARTEQRPPVRLAWSS
jgi:hypothetical protein